MHRSTLPILLATFAVANLSSAQSISLGPQLSLLGIGASASVQVNDFVGFSGEFGFLPIGEQTFDADDIEYNVDPQIAGGLIGVDLYPLGNNFSIGAGIFFGGYAGDAETGTLTEDIEIGDETYTGEEVGTLVGDFKWNGTAPALTLGLRGKGFNVGVGIAFIGSADFDVEATGLLSTDPEFQEELDREIEQARDELDKVPFMPMFRIGYQFGLGN